MAIKKGWDGALYISTNEVAALNSWTISWTGDAWRILLSGQTTGPMLRVCGAR
jgi:hypothetical protein